MFKAYAAVLLVFAPIVLASSSYAQKPAHYREVAPLASVRTDALWCRPKSGGYDTPPVFGHTNGEKCQETIDSLKFDPASQRLIHWSSGGDCHLQVGVKVFKSDVDKRVRVVLNTTYGGCRAAGWKAGWVLIDKPEKGYLVSVENVDIDEIHRAEDRKDRSDFRFPSPPSVITSQQIETRNVDVAGCLPLTGTSQWIIPSKDVLDRALESADQSCRDRLREMNIDFAKQSLVGASFQSGYCGRPDELSYSFIKETSTDRRENAYVLKINYADVPREKMCETYTTYPQWVIAPKIDSGYRFVVDARRNSVAHLPRNVEEKIEWKEER